MDMIHAHVLRRTSTEIPAANTETATMRVFLVGLLPLAATQTTISVSTPTALREAITDGAHIEVANDMVIDDAFVIPAGYDVEIASTNGANIVATDGASHFRIDGKLRLENLVLTNGTAWRTLFCAYTVNGGDSCSGGALHVDKGASLVLVNCVVANSSARYGGGLYAYESDIEIYGTTFERNGNRFPGEAGGAIYTQWHSSLKIVESKFLSNSAPKAGALHVGADAYKDTKISDTQFIGNRAECQVGDAHGVISCWGGEGGAIWLHMGAMTIVGSTFLNNQATKDGPDIHIYPSTGTLSVVSTTFQGSFANGTAAAISYATRTSGPPLIDCEDSCDDLGGGTCAPVDCIGCPINFGGGPCERSCACYSCECADSTFQPTPIPTGPTPLPTPSPTRAPVPRPTPTPTSSPAPTLISTLAPTIGTVWWQASGSTDGAVTSSVASPVAALCVLLAFKFLSG